MAKNLTELEYQLSMLENKRKEQLKILRNDVDLFQESIKPGNLIKTGVKDLFKNPGTQRFLMSSATGIASSLLLGGKAGVLRSVMSQLVSSETVQNFVREDKAGIGKWLDKIKAFLSKKEDSSTSGKQP